MQESEINALEMQPYPYFLMSSNFKIKKTSCSLEDIYLKITEILSSFGTSSDFGEITVDYTVIKKPLNLML